MTFSDWIAIAALCVSIIGVPLGAYLSHRSAVRVFRHETIETRVAQLYDVKTRLDHDLTLFGRLVHTFAKDAGLASTTTDGIHFKPMGNISDPEAFFRKIYDTGIHDRIVGDVERLRELGLDRFLKNHDPIIHESFEVFCLKQEDLAPAKRAELIKLLFWDNGVRDKLAMISKEDLRAFIASD